MHVETFLDMNVICSPICDVASYQNSIPKVNAIIGKVIIDCEVWALFSAKAMWFQKTTWIKTDGFFRLTHVASFSRKSIDNPPFLGVQ